ncbi:MAG: hypothetical protein K2F90_00760 [Clostridiales bacterium]|nr:hypothetical protein [Clostridiales bacterium]
MGKTQDYIRYLGDDRLKDLSELPAFQKLLNIIINDPEQRYQFEIRQNEFTVYYNGGKLSCFKRNKHGKYTTDFDIDYCNNQGKKSVNRQQIEAIGNNNIDGFVNNLKIYTDEMDAWFDIYPKAERANQQILCKKFRTPNDVLWLLDIEFGVRGARFDMLGVDNAGNVKIIELKVGNGSISSRPKNGTDKLQSGLYKHYLDFLKVKQNEMWSMAVIETAKNNISIRKRLGLPTFDGKLNTSLQSIQFEIWLADYSEKGTVLGRELAQIKAAGGSEDIIKINPPYLADIKKEYR